MRGIDFVFPSVTDDIIITWQLANPAGSPEIGRSDPFPPSTDIRTFVPEPLGKKAYIFRFYSSSDGITLETQLRPDWAVDGEMFGNTVEEIHYVVGGAGEYDPAPGQSSLVDPRLLGKNFAVFSRGTGPRRKDEYEVNEVDGGFDLIVQDEELNTEQFNDGDTWTVWVLGEQENSGSDSGSGIIEVETNITFDNEYIGQTLVAKGAGSLLVITFNAFSGIPDGKVKFSTYTGTQRYMRLLFDEGDTVDFAGEERTQINLAADEFIELEFKDGVPYVIGADTRYQDAGETVYTNKKTKRGTLLCDGSGTEHNISDLQRVYDNLPEEMKVSYADWNLTIDVTIGNVTKTYYKNRGKFAIDEINGKMKLPDGRGWSFRSLNNYDGSADATMISQGAGGAKPQNLIKHDHDLEFAPNAGSAGTYVYGRGGGPFGAGDDTKETGGNEQAVDSLGKYIVVIL